MAALDDFLTRTKGASASDAAGDFLARTKGAAPPPVSASEDSWYYDPIAGADIPPASTSSDVTLPSLQNVRSAIQGAEGRILEGLRPGPEATTADQVARTVGAVGVHGLSTLAQLPVNALIGLTEGPSGGATFNPQTGTFGITPEAQTVAGFAANPLRFGGRSVALQSPNLLEGPVPLALEGELLAPQAKTTLASPPGGPRVAVEPSSVPSLAPRTAAEAKAIAGQYYKLNDAQGNRLLPGDFTNQLIDDLKGAMPQGPMEKAVAGEGRLNTVASQLEELRDQPVTLQDAQRTYSRIGDQATAEFKQNGPSETYRALTQIQSDMRERIAPPDLAGNDPWTLARKAWSQAMKMQDLEAISERAGMTDNPATSFRTQIRSLVTNPSRIRGYSPEEVEALKAATERGTLGSIMHVFGSRLLPLAAASAEAGTGGLTGGMAAGLAAHGASSFMRNVATSIAQRKMDNAMRVLAGNVPRDPTLPPPVIEGGNSLAAPLIPGVVNDLVAQYRNQ